MRLHSPCNPRFDLSTRGFFRALGSFQLPMTVDMVKRARAAKPAAPSEPAVSRHLPRWLRGLLSVAVLVHLAAVAAEPLRFASRGPSGPSPAAAALQRLVRPYSEALYLNHGYAFFAPDPGPSHLIRVTIHQRDDTVREEMYPDLSRQWPRLYYHRNFMLAEHLNNVYRPEQPPPMLAQNRRALAGWQAERRLYETLRRSFEEHLQQRYPDARAISLRRVEHRMPGIPEFLVDRIRLDDPRLYRDLPEEFPELGP